MLQKGKIRGILLGLIRSHPVHRNQGMLHSLPLLLEEASSFRNLVENAPYSEIQGTRKQFEMKIFCHSVVKSYPENISAHFDEIPIRQAIC